jgi:hypothetical protein
VHSRFGRYREGICIRWDVKSLGLLLWAGVELIIIRIGRVGRLVKLEPGRLVQCVLGMCSAYFETVVEGVILNKRLVYDIERFGGI